MNVKVVETPTFLLLKYKDLDGRLKKCMKTYSFPNILIYFKRIAHFLNFVIIKDNCVFLELKLYVICNLLLLCWYIVTYLNVSPQ